MGNGASKEKGSKNKTESTATPIAEGKSGGNRKPLTNTDMDIGQNGPTQVIRQPYAPAGAPVR